LAGRFTPDMVDVLWDATVDLLELLLLLCFLFFCSFSVLDAMLWQAHLPTSLHT
jgi:hypothetical protein